MHIIDYFQIYIRSPVLHLAYSQGRYAELNYNPEAVETEYTV